MNSLCIKTNDDKILNYLKKEFWDFNMLNVFYSCNEFKYYKNIIIHYRGIDTDLFYNKLATILSYLVIDYYENDIIKNILKSNYFYFENSELKSILEICTENLCDDEYSLPNRQLLLFDAFYEYITKHHSIVLNGFINFRLYNYRNLLEELIDYSVNSFIIEREYAEFISLLKIYVNSQTPSYNCVHIVCLQNETLILDEELEVIDVDKESLNVKYLSDISFSDNDYILNTLLDIIPKRIYIHLANGALNSEFANTIKLIFEDRVKICTDCDICNLYKKLVVKQTKGGE